MYCVSLFSSSTHAISFYCKREWTRVTRWYSLTNQQVILLSKQFFICLFTYRLIILTFLAAMASICLINMVNLAVENSFFSCFANNVCVSECYRGYIFPSGSTKESYSCQNGYWTPMLSTCKRKLGNVIIIKKTKHFFLYISYLYLI